MKTSTGGQPSDNEGGTKRESSTKTYRICTSGNRPKDQRARWIRSLPPQTIRKLTIERMSYGFLLWAVRGESAPNSQVPIHGGKRALIEWLEENLD